MPNQPKVSVLTPIYNVERFLEQCLQSLTSQTLEDIEFICINDGSTDASLQILTRFADADPRFVVVDKHNEGYGATMNRGLALARGEYVGIVESDDFVDADCFERLYALAQENGMPDIVKADHWRLFTDGHEERRHNLPEDICGRVLAPAGKDAEDAAKLILTTPAIWAAIYKRDFLVRENIRFLESPGAAFQDTGFVFKSWIGADSVYVADDAFLHYRTLNEGSSSASADKMYCVCDEWASIDDFLFAHLDRMEALLPTLAVKRLQTYWWNLKRIAPDAREEFASRAAGELAALQEQHVWDDAPLKKGERKRLARWLEDPVGLVIDLNVKELEKRGEKVPLSLKLRRKMHAGK